MRRDIAQERVGETTKDCLWIESGQMWTIGKWWIIKGEREPMLGCVVSFDWRVNYASQKGLLVAGLQYLDSWALVVSLRRKEWANKGTDLRG